VILGTLAQALVIGKGDTTNVELRDNLIAYTGHIAVNLTASNYEFFDNTVVTGGGKGALSYRGATEVSGDRNLYWGTNRQERTLLLITDNGFYSDFDKYLAQTAIDQKSVSRDPKFASAPLASSNIDTERLEAAASNSLPFAKATLLKSVLTALPDALDLSPKTLCYSLPPCPRSRLTERPSSSGGQKSPSGISAESIANWSNVLTKTSNGMMLEQVIL